jgi:hypothetical protein
VVGRSPSCWAGAAGRDADAGVPLDVLAVCCAGCDGRMLGELRARSRRLQAPPAT